MSLILELAQVHEPFSLVRSCEERNTCLCLSQVHIVWMVLAPTPSSYPLEAVSEELVLIIVGRIHPRLVKRDEDEVTGVRTSRRETRILVLVLLRIRDANTLKYLSSAISCMQR